MRFARLTFAIAATYGLLVLPIAMFGARGIGEQYPPAITHVEYFYAFMGLAFVFQFIFVLIARDPIRYRPLMLISVFEKLSFFIPAVILKLVATIPPPTFAAACIDGVLGVFFAMAFLQTRAAAATGGAAS